MSLAGDSSQHPADLPGRNEAMLYMERIGASSFRNADLTMVLVKLDRRSCFSVALRTTLDEVQPRRRRGREVQVPAPLGGLASHSLAGVLVDGVVVQHQVDVEVAGDPAVGDLQERQEVPVAVPREAAPGTPPVPDLAGPGRRSRAAFRQGFGDGPDRE